MTNRAEEVPCSEEPTSICGNLEKLHTKSMLDIEGLSRSLRQRARRGGERIFLAKAEL